MHRQNRITLLCLLLTLSACTSTDRTTLTTSGPTHFISQGTRINLPTIETGKRPEWLIRDHHDYPRNDFYSVTAQDNNAEAAAKKTYADAIKLLQPTDDAVQIGALQAQIKIVSLWSDDKNYHALAVLPRQQSVAFLYSQLNNLDATTQASVTALNTTEDPLQKIGLLQTAIERQQLRAAYQKSLKKIDPAKEGRESPWDTRRWSLEVAALLKNLRITPVMVPTPSNPTALTDTLKQGLENAGLRPARKFEADYILTGTLHIEEKTLASGYTQAIGHLNLTLQDDKQNRSYGVKSWQLEATSLSADGAKERMLNKARRLLKQNQRKTIIGIATQPTERLAE